MVKMRIGIREQLGLLVLLTTLSALAVVAIATVRHFPLQVSSISRLLMMILLVGQQLQSRSRR